MTATDDQYAISRAKTAYRDAYNTGDLDLLLNVFCSGFTDCSEGEPSFYGEEAAQALRIRTTELFRSFDVRMSVIIVNIVVKDDFAYDRGWHNVRLTAKDTGQVSDLKYRYFETWKKENGSWKIAYIMTNRELPPRMLADSAAGTR